MFVTVLGAASGIRHGSPCGCPPAPNELERGGEGDVSFKFSFCNIPAERGKYWYVFSSVNPTALA